MKLYRLLRNFRHMSMKSSQYGRHGTPLKGPENVMKKGKNATTEPNHGAFFKLLDNHSKPSYNPSPVVAQVD